MKSSVIFIIDKNPIHRNLIKYNLEKLKFTNVQTFLSWEDCLYRIQKKDHPDFIITSFFSGDQNGFDFLLSVLEISPSSQVIYFDTFEDSQLTRMLIDAGASDYVVKTRNPDAGISELLKNVCYLARKKTMVSVH